MSLSHLNIHHVRNISVAQLELHPRYNLIFGANGSGKTSFLEAIYLLGNGHSFRTREITPLISYEEEALTVFGRTTQNDSISIQKNRAHGTQVKLNQQFCRRSSELAQFLPCQIFYQDIFQIIDAGPMVRRNLLDWGLFHVKHSYLNVWQDYRRVLKQRNALLKQKINQSNFRPWDNQLIELAEELDRMRSEYFSQWSNCFQKHLKQLTDIECTIHYYKGWDRKNAGKSFASILEEQFNRDCQYQYTHCGAHQADIVFDTATLSARQRLSRGQQKMVLIALKLAQAYLLEKSCLYLFDDIVAELDLHHIERFIQCISENHTGQFFLTANDSAQSLFTDQFKNSRQFLIKDGQLS
jgi:DNA replication and repair protein RecF